MSYLQLSFLMLSSFFWLFGWTKANCHSPPHPHPPLFCAAFGRKESRTFGWLQSFFTWFGMDFMDSESLLLYALCLCILWYAYANAVMVLSDFYFVLVGHSSVRFFLKYVFIIIFVNIYAFCMWYLFMIMWFNIYAYFQYEKLWCFCALFIGLIEVEGW